ncbi:MAG TPA: hypothetical protein VGK73_06005 [Polyangiaceae bacterium]
MSSACGSSPSGFLETESYVTEDGQVERQGGSGCLGMDAPPLLGDWYWEGGPESTATIDGKTTRFAYRFRYEWSDEGVHFSLKDGDGAEVAARDYDADFADAGSTDEVSARVTGGSVRYVHRAVERCSDAHQANP